MMRHKNELFHIFFNCIDALIENPHQSIGEFEILTKMERQRLLGEFRQQEPQQYSASCLHQLFEQQVTESPENIAVYSQDTVYTYLELDQRANKLAHYLIELGVNINDTVGLSFNKHPDMIVAIMAILKAGGGYVPLDPGYPEDRLQYMIEDSGINILITQQELEARLPTSNCNIVSVDRQWAEIATRENSRPDIEVPLDSLAYIIYTSGSTGVSKGVMIEHDSIVNYTLAAQDAFGFSQADKVLQFASISFDTAGEEIFPTLACGASLYLADENMKASAKGFIEGCRREDISFVDLPTAFWHQITAAIVEDKLALPESIRCLIIGGERAQPQAVANWLELKNNIKLVNTYGPTECTIVSSYCELNTDNSDRNQEVPIGIPVKNLYAYVLDKKMQLVPIGVTGELHIGGAGLARGYLGKDQLTQEKFVKDPVAENSTALLYKTGDLVRFRNDGLLEYRDRADDQVKIRGYRIELGEVESALLKVDEIEQGIVLVDESDRGEKRLVAYYVTQSGNDISESQTRSALRKILPDYMMPQFIRKLDALPINATGKVNRAALPEVVRETEILDDEDYAAPETDSQKAIAGVWQNTLQIDRAGLYDNFFDIGGDSLLMMQVIANMEKELQLSATPRMLVSFNLAQLAGEFDQQKPATKNENLSAFAKVKKLFRF